MKVIGKRIGEPICIMEIENNLKSFQEFVEGYIEMPYISKEIDMANVVIICNEEGKVNQLQPTIAISCNDEIIDVLCGQVIFAGKDGADQCSLTNEQINFIANKIIKNGACNNNGDMIDILEV